MAKTLCKSELLPKAYRNNPANTLIAMEYGEMLAIHWLTATTHIHVIDGKPSQSAELMRARVRSAGHKFRTLEENATRATVQIVLADDPDFPTTVTFTAEPDPEAAGSARDAGALDLWFEEWRNGPNNRNFKVTWICPPDLPWKCDDETLAKAGAPEWVLKQGGAQMKRNESWWKFRPAMLHARATSACVRAACSEVLMGVSWTPEEMGREVGEDGTIIDAESWEDTPKPPPETVDEETGEALRKRANALPKDGQATFRTFLNEREITGFPLNMRATKVKVVAAQLDLLEKLAKDATDPATPLEDAPEPRVTEGVRIPPPPGAEDEDGIVEAELVPDEDGPIPAIVDLTHGWEFDDVVSMDAEAMVQLPDEVLRNACLAFRRPAADGLDHAQLIAAVVAARDAA